MNKTISKLIKKEPFYIEFAKLSTFQLVLKTKETYLDDLAESAFAQLGENLVLCGAPAGETVAGRHHVGT